jgi:hypothetical protein
MGTKNMARAMIPGSMKYNTMATAMATIPYKTNFLCRAIHGDNRFPRQKLFHSETTAMTIKGGFPL